MDLARLRRRQTRSISPENPSGARGGGARAVDGTGAAAARDLGPGWKISPSVDVKAGETFEVAAIAGAGKITHIWMTAGADHWRSLILRCYWDGSSEPAVEVPLGDFFCNGWGTFCQVSSMPIASNPHGGFNSYWPMPFRTAARVTIENTSTRDARFYFQVDYELGGEHSEDGYLHAQWRRSNPLPSRQPHTLVDDVEGRGHFVGTYIAWGVNSNGWWGEGEVKFYLDDDEEHPTICGTGTEDYFGGAWNFEVPGHGYTTFSTPYLGMPQVIRPDGLYASQQRFGMYRWHLADPVHFETRLRAEVQALGWRSGGRYLPLQDDIASTVVFYLDKPFTRRPAAPTFDQTEVFTGSEPAPRTGDALHERVGAVPDAGDGAADRHENRAP
jgi:hypothetical protein